jgi:alpha-beta hydrolase superfamily lysophospholipase
MKIQFDDPLFEAWTQRFLFTMPEGGCEIGEIKATAARIPEGDRDAWYREWTATADRLFAEAEARAAHGSRVSARYLYLRASTYYRMSYPLLYGHPTDPRVKAGYAREAEAFTHAAALFDPPIVPVVIPFAGTTLPGWFYSGGPGTRPLIIGTNGYDETVQIMHYGHAAAAQRRGYHVLTFDGPGQGRVLIEDGVPMRPDWEKVIRVVVDFALTLPSVDPVRIALAGWSFGGYLAPRAASGEQRLAALIADPGQWDLIAAIRAIFPRLGVSAEVAKALPDVDEAALEPAFAAIRENPQLNWSFVQRGLWVHGVRTLMDYLRVCAAFRLSDRVSAIRCPTLVTTAENDPVAAFAGRLYDALMCPKTLIRFTAAEGAGDHCEASARSVYFQRAYDWLDGVFGMTATRPRSASIV